MTRRSINTRARIACTTTLFTTLSVLAAACGGGGGNGAPTDPAAMTEPGLGRSPAGIASGESNSGRLLTETCRSGDSSKICIGVKYVVYKHANGTPVVSQETMVSNMARINEIWKTCNIGFQVEKYENVTPADKGLANGSEAANQTEQIRAAYMEKDTFDIVTTENWGTTKNAWTNPPGSATHGVVLEGAVGDYPSIIAHELGHYLSLDHVDGPSNDLMYYAIVANPAPLDSSQCSAARASALKDWVPMLRK